MQLIRLGNDVRAEVPERVQLSESQVAHSVVRCHAIGVGQRELQVLYTSQVVGREPLATAGADSGTEMVVASESGDQIEDSPQRHGFAVRPHLHVACGPVRRQLQEREHERWAQRVRGTHELCRMDGLAGCTPTRMLFLGAGLLKLTPHRAQALCARGDELGSSSVLRMGNATSASQSCAVMVSIWSSVMLVPVKSSEEEPARGLETNASHRQEYAGGPLDGLTDDRTPVLDHGDEQVGAQCEPT
jgi:hypothetical protein